METALTSPEDWPPARFAQALNNRMLDLRGRMQVSSSTRDLAEASDAFKNWAAERKGTALVAHWTDVETAEDVTPEILTAAEGVFDGWFADEKSIDWENFLDRLDGMRLEDDSRVNLGNDMESPAIKKIKAHIRAYRRLG